jgi:hypothetical protein
VTEVHEDGFTEGMRRGVDRTNSGVDGPAVTTANSFWVAGGQQVCPVCRHTFRVNDRVHVTHGTGGSAARVVHASDELPCHGDATGGQQDDPALTTEFYAAIDRLDPLNQVAKRLKPTSWLVADLPKRPPVVAVAGAVTVMFPASAEPSSQWNRV